MLQKILTLCLIRNGDQVLLGMKKRGFGAGRWNGFGGKLQEGESIEEATKREVLEECGLTVKAMELVGVFDFEFALKPEWNQTVHLFRGDEFEGELAESEEMKPQWFHKNEIPLDSMWPDDRHWFPHFLADQKFKGRFLFGEGDAVLEYNLDLIDSF
ncbi:MAG: 8-oxo-dGTP diphosphatase [Patescibacteria group bacterium]